MKAFLLVAGTVFSLLAALTVVIIYEHWGEPRATPWFVVAHAAIGIGCAALAVWAFRLTRRVATPSG